MAPVASTVAALLLTLSSGARVLRSGKTTNTTGHLQGLSVASVPMYMYKRDCWKKRHWSLLQKDAIPGTGMDLGEITPFQTVLKDGYYQVDCVKDYMLEFGDKHGRNKYQYNQGPISNVSIVRYEDVVPKMDQEPMSHSVCFAFCRGLKNMTFFGIQNGRRCYCAPYYQEMESDSSMCDAVCEGETTLICGGKTKSTIFSMHSCAKTGQELAEAGATAGTMLETLSGLVGEVEAIAGEMQSIGETLQKIAGNAGDSDGAALCQDMKVYAGKLLEASSSAAAVEETLTGLKTEADGMTVTQATDSVTKAEGVIEKIEMGITEGEEKSEELSALVAKAQPTNETAAASKQYYHVMYFVDKAYDNLTTTCGGDTVGNPMVGKIESCAEACDKMPHDCVAFSFTPLPTSPSGGACFLFSKLKTATYYTGCDKSAKEKTTCMVKYAEFDGMTLKPDPSGKCKACLKEAKEAARCFE